MSRFRDLQRNGFSGCVLLHQGIDSHRNRPAKYFALPGDFTLIGYSDNTDTFLIPISDFIPREALLGLEKIRSGGVHVAAVVLPTRVRRVFKEDPADVEQASNTRRRRIFND